LNNDDIALANAIITIPLNPEFTSLNLAQAVLLIAYEFMIKGKILPNEAKQAEAATAEEIDFFTSRLNAEIEKAGFFRSADMMPTAKRAVTNLFTRQSWTTQDIAMFQGILSAFTKDK
jgi:tRNA/rRNA methyltransferase